MRNLLTRSLSGFVYVSLFLAAILFSSESYIALTGIFGAVCIWEFSKLIQHKSIVPYIWLGVILYASYISLKIEYIHYVNGFTIAGLGILIYLLFSHKPINSKNTLQKLFLQIIYIILPFYYLINLPFINGIYKPNIVIYILILIWVNDSFAYLVGKNFGKHKLFVSVSPKKTIEGFIGGWVFALIASLIISKYSDFNYVSWLIIASLVSIFGTIGDLVESKFKRQANIKDSGSIMPGHGGLLDRLDSLFFAAPFVFLYIHFLL